MSRFISGAAARAAAVLLLTFASSLPLLAVTKTWTNNNGSGDGRWLTASNWSPAGVPTATDVVEIGVTDQTSNYCTIDGAAIAQSITLGNSFTNNPTLEIKSGATLTIGSASTTDYGTTLYLNNGSLTGNGSLAVSGQINFNGGQLTGPGGLTINSVGVIHFQLGANYCYLGRNTTNDGTIQINAGAYDAYLLTSAVITNNGLIDFQGDESLWASGAGPFRIDNQSGGVVRKSGGAGTTGIKTTLNNASGALVEADTGTLQLEGGGTSSGQFDAAASTTLSIASATYTFGSGATVTGLGKLALNTTLTVSAGADVTVPNLHMVSGSSVVDGTGTLRIGSALDWDGGTMTGGGLTVLQGSATTALDCTTNYCYLNNRQFNLGTGSTTNYTAVTYALYLQNAALLHVNSGATFDIQSDADVNNGGGTLSSMTSDGTIQKSGGSAATFFGVPLTSSGTISVTQGDLQFPAGATINGGTLNSGTTSNIDVTAGTFQFASAATISGTGAFRVVGGTMRIPTGVTQLIPALTLASGAVIDGGGTLQLQGNATWNGGTMGSAAATGGVTEVLAGSTLTIVGSGNYAYLDYDRQLVNNGTVNYTGTTYSFNLYNSADVVNNGVFDMQNDLGIGVGGSGPRLFTNNGTLTKSAGTAAGGAYIYPELDNAAAGTIDVTSGRLNLHGGGTSSGAFTIGAGAFLQITATYDVAGAPTVTGAGTLRVAGGNLVVPAGVTLSVPQLALDSGYVSGAGTLELTGISTWSGGTMGHATYSGGTTRVMTGAQLIINGASGYAYIDQGRTLVNDDVIDYTAPSFGIWIYNGGTLNNTGTFNYNTDVGIGVSGSGNTILNTGLIYKTTGSGAPIIAVPLNNSGTIQSDAGTLLLGGGGTHSGGQFVGNGAGTTGFSAGTHTLDAASALTGTGTILVSGGTVTVSGTYNPGSLTISGGTLTLDSNGTASVFAMSNGILNGTGTFTILDDSTWAGGTMSGSGTTILDALQTLTINAATTYCYLDGRTFTNNGTILYSPAPQYLQIYNGATLNNAGTFTITDDQLLYGVSGGTINNSGTITKTAGTGTTTISAVVNNSGTVDVSSGTLAFSGNGTHTGNFTLTAGTVAFAGGTHTVSGPGTISGAGTLAFTGGLVTVGTSYAVGTLKITSGTATLDANGSAGTLDMSSGTLNGSGVFTADEGGTWSGGTMSGSGQTVIPATKILNISGATTYNYLETRTLTNNGTINYTAAPYYLYIYSNGTLNNAGTFNIQSDQAIPGVSAGTFNNSGTVTRSVTSGTTAVGAVFNNSGTVTLSTGTLQLGAGGTSSGTWSIAAPATLAFQGGTFTVTAGSLSGTGTLAFTGGAATVSVPYTVGTLNVAGGTATLDANGSADAFTMSAGTLGGSGTFTANNGGTWTGGTMSGTGATIIPAGQTFTINASAGYCTIDTRTVNNNGIATYTSSGASPYLQILNNGALNNAGSFTINGASYIWGSGNGTINNSGTLTKAGGALIEIATVVNNTGQLTVTAGTMSMQAGGTHTNGVFTATSPATIQFSGGTHAISGAGAVGGTGNYLVTNGAVTVAVPYTVAALTISGGTATFDANGSIGALNFTSGTLSGSGTVTLAENGTWSGGTMSGTGTTVLSAGKTYTLGGTNYTSVDTRTVVNNGTLNYVAPTYYFYLANGGTLDNAGTLAIQTDLYIYSSGAGTINNSGTISRTSGTANTTDIYPAVNNDGTVLATQGGLAFHGNGTHNGTFTATDPGSITFAGGTQTANATSALGGTGTYRFTGANITVDGTWGGTPVAISAGTATFNTSATIPSLTLTGGTLSGSGNVTVTGNSTWGGGTMDGTGTTIFDTGATVTMNGTPTYTTLSRPLQNLGTIDYSSAAYYLQLDGATLTNDGTFNVLTDVLLYAYGTSPLFQNNGTLRKTAGAGSMQFYAPLTNAGVVQVGSGTMYFSNTYTQTAGTTELLNNATLQTATLNLDGGSLIGNGTIAGNVVSDAVVAPGLSAGALTISGSYTQTATGALNVELGGTTAGTGYDQLNVTGAVTLAGDLNVAAINGFLPASGNTFQVLTFGSRPGTTDFTNKNGLNLGSGTNLIPAYSATDLQLTTNTVQTDLQLAMTASAATVTAGASFTYNATVTNHGGSNASGVAVSGTLPANVTFAGSAPAICTGAPNLVCSFGSIPNGGSAGVTITVTATGSGTATFNATATGSQFDPNGANNAASASTNISASADLAVTIAAAPDPVTAGAAVTYTVVVTNNGPSSAPAVGLALAPSADLTFASASAPCSGGFPCALGTLNSGQSVTVTATYNVAPAAGANVQLVATVDAASPDDPAPANDTATASTTVVQDADVQVVKTGPSNVPPESGSTVTYNIAVTNNGPSVATTVVLDDPTPAGLTLDSVTGACTAFPCTIPSMAVGETQNVAVTYTIDGAVGTTFTNTATVTAGSNSDSSSVTTTVSNCPAAAITAPAQVNGSSTGNAASVTAVAGATYSWSIGNGTITSGATTSAITFTAGATGVVTLSATVTGGACSSSASATVPIVDADLAVTKSGPANVSPVTSSQVTYTINVVNNGPSPAADVTLTDPTPSGLTFVSATGGCTAFPCALGNMPAGASIAIQATYSFSESSQTVTNVATVTSPTPDRTPANNSSSATTSINACPAVAITAPTALEPGGSSTAQTTDITGATYVWSIANGTITAGQGSASIAFTAGTAGTTTLTVNVTAGQCSRSANHNIAVTSNQADVRIQKTAPSSVDSGAEIAYTLTISNDGPASADAVSVTDALPEGTTLSSVSSAACTGTSLISCSLGTLAPGATQTIVITVTAPAGPATLINTASVGTNSADPNAANDSSSVTTSVREPETVCPTGTATALLPSGTTVTSPVTFSWSAAGGAAGYVVHYRVGNGPVREAGSTTDATSLIAPVEPGVITWFVDALFAGCPATRSDEATFTVQQLAECEGTAIPTAPANGSTSNATVTFTWTAVPAASGYRVWLQSGAAPAEVLATTNGTSLTKTIAAGTHTFWTETLFAGCPSRASQHVTFTVLPAQNCGERGRPSLLAPANGSNTSSANVSFTWTNVAGAIEYELWLAPSAGVPTLVGTTASTSLTAEVAPGTLEWFVRAVFNGCPATESDRRTFTYEPPTNCVANERPVLIAPAEGERVASPVSFDWNDVAGATAYELWIAHGNAQPSLVATTTVSHSGGVNRDLGAGRWFVRAKFAAGCAALDSTESRFVVIPQAAACSDLDAPLVSLPGQISAGANARVQWSFVPGATGYVLETSSDPTFPAGATTSTDMGNARQQLFTLDNDTSGVVEHYVRVRAVDTRCPAVNHGPFSPTAILYVLPRTGGEASAQIGDAATVEYTLPLGGELAGQPFTATPTRDWITVTPASGVVPAGGMSLTVVAHTAGLPPGTNIGGVAITTGSAGRVGTHGFTTVNAPVSVNLVSPVTPAPKNTPPPDALVIPAVANADGIGSHFQSDVRVSNTSAQVMKYQLSFIPTGDAGITAGRQTTFSIEPGRTVALDDILKSWFGTGSTNAIGTLEVRPLTEVNKSTSSAAVGALANLVTFASSRTFNITPNGTFGQFIPAIPFANFVGSGKVLSLQQIASSQQFRTNLGLVEGSGEPASLLIRVFGSTGSKLAEFPVNLVGGQHTQLNGFLAQHGVASLDDGRVEVEVIGGNGKVTAYASVLDNQTADPLLVSPVTLDDAGNTRWVLPGVADLDNGAANWQTDMRVFNAGGTPEELTLAFHSMNGGEPKTATMTLQPGEVRQLDKLLASTFGVTQNGGAVHVTTADAARLIATARTYNQTTQGTYGQFISAVTPAEAVGVGSRPLQLLQVEESSRYRSNIGLAEVTGKPVTVEVSIVPPDAKFTAKVNVELAANEFRQLTSMLTALGLGETYNARVTVRAVAGEGRATAYASVIDAKTNDPTYVPAQ